MLVALSLYTLLALVAAIDGVKVQRRLAGKVSAKMVGALLISLGSRFLRRTIAVLASALINQSTVVRSELALLITDFRIVYMQHQQDLSSREFVRKHDIYPLILGTIAYGCNSSMRV